MTVDNKLSLVHSADGGDATSDGQKLVKSENASKAPRRSWVSRKQIISSIFDSEDPEGTVSQLTPLQLHSLVTQQGLLSSSDLVELSTQNQCQSLIDFSVWNKDRISEDLLFDWLRLSDATEGFELLEKIVSCIDLKVIAFILGKYVDVHVSEEPTDLPPGKGYYTPDKGNTWISIDGSNADRHFYIGKLLAFVFEKNAKLFYQLIAIQTIQTPSIIEEEAYQDKNKRVIAQGVPDAEQRILVTTPILPYEYDDLFKGLKEKVLSYDLISQGSFVEDDIEGSSYYPSSLLGRATGCFGKMFAFASNPESFDAEFTLIVNSVISRWGLDFASSEVLKLVASQVRSTIQIGFDIAIERLFPKAVKPEIINDEKFISALSDKLGLQTLFKLGLYPVLALRERARKFSASVGHTDLVRQLSDGFDVDEVESVPEKVKGNVFKLNAYGKRKVKRLPVKSKANDSRFVLTENAQRALLIYSLTQKGLPAIPEWWENTGTLTKKSIEIFHHQISISRAIENTSELQTFIDFLPDPID